MNRAHHLNGRGVPGPQPRAVRQLLDVRDHGAAAAWRPSSGAPWEHLLRFGLVGCLNTAIDLLVLNGLLWLFPTQRLGLLLLENSLAYSVAASNSFLCNRGWTFHVPGRAGRRAVGRFAVMTLAGVACNTLLLWLLGTLLHPVVGSAVLWVNASKLVAIGGSVVISYLGLRLWVFGRPAPASRTAPPTQRQTLPTTPRAATPTTRRHADDRRRPRRAAVLLYGGAALSVIALHLVTNGTLGFHIDELYYLACGRHLAFGYVDFPPIVPLLARLETSLLGVTPWTLRLLPALISGLLVVLSGAYVRRLGGTLALQGLGLLIAITVPFLLGTWLFQTVIFDQLTWMLALYWFLSLVRLRKARYWMLLGLTLGIGLEVKDTILALIVGIAVAVVLTPSLRKELRTRYPWMAVGLIVVLWTPNVLWQIGHGFPTLPYLFNHQGSTGGMGAYLAGLLVLLALLLPLWIRGFIALFRQRALRPLGIACVIPLAVFLFAGKYYYAAPTIPLVLAQGLIAVSQIERRKLRSGVTVAVVVASLLDGVVLAHITVPLIPARSLHASGLDTYYGDTVGWPELTHQLTALYAALPPAERQTTVIISAYYGVPGALAIYGNPQVLPDVLSPQLSDWFWLPQTLRATDALMVDYQPADVAWMCRAPRVMAHLTVPYHVMNLEQGAPVTFCALKAPLPRLWGRLRNFS